MADIRLAKPAAGASESVQCAPEARFVFDFPTTDATLARDGDNLTISFEDGGKLQLEGFYQEYNGENLPSFTIDGTEVAAADFFQAMNEPDLMPAAGPGTGTVANGARFHEWGDSALASGITHLNGLDWGFSRNFEWDDVPNAVGRNGDEGGLLFAGGPAGPGNTVPDLDVPVAPGRPYDPRNPGDDPNDPASPQNPGGYIPNTHGASIVVDEGALAKGSGQHVLHGASGTGAFVADVHAERGGTIELSFGGKVVTLEIPLDGSLSIAPSGDAGFANVNGVDVRILGAQSAGDGKWTVRYEYRLADHIDHDKQLGQDTVRYDGDGIAIKVTDGSGDVTTGKITVEVHDDVARAADDFARLAEGETVSGNVLTGNEHGGSDIYGADGQGSFGGVQVRWNLPQGTPEGEDAAGHYYDVSVDGLFTAKLYDNGDYVFTANKVIDGLDSGDTPVKLPAYGYTIVDGDGDVSSATLTVTINADPHTPDLTHNPGDPDPVPDPGNPDKPLTPDPVQPENGDGKIIVTEAAHTAQAMPIDADAADGTISGERGQLLPGASGAGSFNVNLHGEGGVITVGGEGGYTITVDGEGNIVSFADNTNGHGLMVEGVGVGFEEAGVEWKAAEGVWTIHYAYALTGPQMHETPDMVQGDVLTDSIPIEVIDETGDRTGGAIKVEVHDDGPVIEVVGQTADVNFGADNEGRLLNVEVFTEKGGPLVWTKDGTEEVALKDMNNGDTLSSGDFTVEKTLDGYRFSTSRTDSKDTLIVKATDADGDTTTAQVVVATPKIDVPTVEKEEPDPNDDTDVPASGEAAIVVDDAALLQPNAQGHHAEHGSEGSDKYFTVDVHGEKGGSIVLSDGKSTVTLQIPTGEETTIARPHNATQMIDGVKTTIDNPALTVKGVEVTITGATLGTDGKWHVYYDYTLTEHQVHDKETPNTGEGTTLDGAIDITVTDGTGDVTTGQLNVEVHDDTPLEPTFTSVSSGMSYGDYASASFIGNFSIGWEDDDYHQPHATLNSGDNSYWTPKYRDYFMKEENGKATNIGEEWGSYAGIVDGIVFIPTSAHYTLAEDGSLLSVRDVHTDAPDYRDKNFYLTNKGLTVGSDQKSFIEGYQLEKHVWNEHEVGLSPGNKNLTGNQGYSEAIMIEQPENQVAYGVTIDLGSIEVGDRILLSFFLTPLNSDDNDLVKTVTLEPTERQIQDGSFSTTIQIPDGFSKLLVSALPSTGGEHNSGFTLQGVAFGKPVYETSVFVADVDFGADGAAPEGALAWSFDNNGWNKETDAADGATKYSTSVTITSGLGKGPYGLDITIDKNGVMTGILTGGPEEGLKDRTLFEWHYDAEKGEKGAWEFNQYYNFEFEGGGNKILATLTATDADGDSKSSTLDITLTETPLERFDKVSTGYYDFKNWSSVEERDTATDFMAGDNINDLIYAKGGNDIVSGDGGVEAFRAILGKDGLNLDADTADYIVGKVNSKVAPVQDDYFHTVTDKDKMWQNADEVYKAINGDTKGFRDQLDAIEQAHKDWAGNDAIYGGLGKDVLLGWGGNDYLEGDAGRDFLFAGGGNDIIIYDAEDAYIDGGKGFDILLADKKYTGSLASLTKAHRVEMLIRSEREDDVKNLSINTLASLEMYGIILVGTEGAWEVKLEDTDNGSWGPVQGKTCVFSDDEGPLFSLEVADSVTIKYQPPVAGPDAPTDDAQDQTYSEEETTNDNTPDTEGSGARLFAMRRSAPADEDEGDAGHAAGGATTAGKNVIEGDGEEPNTLFGTDGDDVIIGGSAGDFIDGGAGSDTIYAGAGDDLIVYDATDYLIDGGDGIDFLISGSSKPTHSLADMLDNWAQNGADKGTPMVHDVEVMLKGVNTGLQNMDALAKEYGFSMEKDGNGRDILVLDKDKWALDESQSGNGTNTYVNAESGVTLETTLADVSAGSTDAGEQAAQTIVLASNG